MGCGVGWLVITGGGVVGVCVTGEWLQVLLVCVLQVNGCRCYWCVCYR